MKNPYDAPWSQRQAEQMYAALVECTRIAALLLDDDGPADARGARALHEELRRVLAGVGLVAARPPRPKATPPAPLVRDRARQTRIQRAGIPTTARKKSKT